MNEYRIRELVCMFAEAQTEAEESAKNLQPERYFKGKADAYRIAQMTLLRAINNE